MVFEKGKVQSNPAYSRPDIIQRIYQLRNQGTSYNKTAKMINEEFDLKITLPTIKVIYAKYITKNKLAAAPEYLKKMDERFEKISQVTDDLIDTLVEMKKNVPLKTYIKFIPAILAVCREILAQLTYIKKEQAQVLSNQSKLIYSPLQIMNVVNNELVKLEKIKEKLADSAPEKESEPEKDVEQIVLENVKEEKEEEKEAELPVTA